MAESQTTTTRGPEPTKGPVQLWRVDIGGVPVSVYGEEAYRYLQTVNHDLAIMKIALHRIAKMTHGDISHGIARGALDEISTPSQPDWRRETVRKQIDELGRGNPCRVRTAND